MKGAWSKLVRWFWGGTACCDAEVATVALPLALGAIRIASDVDLLDHSLTHG
jgi:hypothetical protein